MYCNIHRIGKDHVVVADTVDGRSYNTDAVDCLAPVIPGLHDDELTFHWRGGMLVNDIVLNPTRGSKPFHIDLPPLHRFCALPASLCQWGAWLAPKCTTHLQVSDATDLVLPIKAVEFVAIMCTQLYSLWQPCARFNI